MIEYIQPYNLPLWLFQTLIPGPDPNPFRVFFNENPDPTLMLNGSGKTQPFRVGPGTRGLGSFCHP